MAKAITLEITRLTLKISILLSFWAMAVVALWTIAKSAMAMVI